MYTGAQDIAPYCTIMINSSTWSHRNILISPYQPHNISYVTVVTLGWIKDMPDHVRRYQDHVMIFPERPCAGNVNDMWEARHAI